jgi:CubicO group peptidase (beta-lactamase class C family)
MPASAHMSSERLDRMDTMINAAIANNEIPGAVALVARNGKIVYWKAFGKADASAKRDLKRDDIFRIASQTKAVTSTAVMMLWEQGLFKMDDPVSKYIPEFKDPQVLDTYNAADGSYTTKPASREITLRDLITHTSGIGYGMIDANPAIRAIYAQNGIIDAFSAEEKTVGENIKKLAKMPLHHNPGEKFTYSEGIDVLGYFVEIMSGMPLAQYLDEHIFKPLQMNDTAFTQPTSKASRLVEVQTLKDNKWKPFTTDRYDINYPLTNKGYHSGGAGLSSTAIDYAKFLQMYLNGGEYNGVRLLSSTTVNMIMSNQIGDIWAGTPAGHGLAFKVANDRSTGVGGIGSEGTFEWAGYFNTQYYADPKENLIGIIMKQTVDLPRNSDTTEWKYRIIANQAIDN